MTLSLAAIVAVIAVALAFDFMNGFHDAANSIATVVSTRVLKPYQAVLWAAFFNFIAFMFFGLHVANTIGKDVIDGHIINNVLIFSALVGAISWNVITWYFGIPSSSSHALIGGLVGGAVAKAGFSSLKGAGLTKISVSIVLSPLFGFVLGYIIMGIVSLIFYRSTPKKVDRWGRKMQLLSAALYSLGHGGNDAQKTMGIISVLLFANGYLGQNFSVPLWVVLSCHGAMGLGTLFGGWRIVKTMGMRITKLKPVGGFSAETSGAATLFLATGLGIPVSTTHTITGSIMGVGTFNRIGSVRWAVAERIVMAWILTIPASSLIAAATYLICNFLFVRV